MTILYVVKCEAFAAFVKNPNNATTCLGSSSTFMCETNGTERPLVWFIQTKHMPWTVESRDPSSTLMLPATGQNDGATVLCYVSSSKGTVTFSSPAFLSV